MIKLDFRKLQVLVGVDTQCFEMWQLVAEWEGCFDFLAPPRRALVIEFVHMAAAPPPPTSSAFRQTPPSKKMIHIILNGFIENKLINTFGDVIDNSHKSYKTFISTISKVL